MEEALIQVGLPVKCGTCKERGFVKPGTDYNGWHKSRLLRGQSTKKWYCPGDHADWARELDRKFYEENRNPEPEPPVENVEDELYKLLD